MRLLLIKMSSMGDVFHLLPALTDAMQAMPNLQVDWVVEKAFSEIPTWHPAVKQVFAIELRKWRKHPWQHRQDIAAFFEQIKLNQYDLIVDAQGLLKSVWVARKIRKDTQIPIAGFDWQSAREPLASLFYQHTYRVEKQQHAIVRLRNLLSQALGYAWQLNAPIRYDLALPEADAPLVRQWAPQSYWVMLHGTTWDTKLWPESYWLALAKQVVALGYGVVLPWGNEVEKSRSESIVKQLNNHQAWCPDTKLNLSQMAHLLKQAKQVVSVDTGLSHVAAALEVPLLVLYRVTNPVLVGACGEKVQQLKSPCAERYLKRFKSADDEANSLQGLAVEDVLDALNLSEFESL